MLFVHQLTAQTGINIHQVICESLYLLAFRIWRRCRLSENGVTAWKMSKKIESFEINNGIDRGFRTLRLVHINLAEDDSRLLEVLKSCCALSYLSEFLNLGQLGVGYCSNGGPKRNFYIMLQLLIEYSSYTLS